MKKKINIKIDEKDYLIILKSELGLLFGGEHMLIKSFVYDPQQKANKKKSFFDKFKKEDEPELKLIQSSLHTNVNFIGGNFYYDEKSILNEIKSTLKLTENLVLIDN